MGTQGGPEWRPAENILVDRKMPVGKFRVGAVHVGYVTHVQNDIRSGGRCRGPGQHGIPNQPLVNTGIA